MYCPRLTNFLFNRLFIFQVFSGATDRSTPVKQVFDVAIKTFAVIVNPVTYHGNDICMRIELYGTGNCKPYGVLYSDILCFKSAIDTGDGRRSPPS